MEGGGKGERGSLNGKGEGRKEERRGIEGQGRIEDGGGYRRGRLEGERGRGM